MTSRSLSIYQKEKLANFFKSADMKTTEINELLVPLLQRNILNRLDLERAVIQHGSVLYNHLIYSLSENMNENRLQLDVTYHKRCIQSAEQLKCTDMNEYFRYVWCNIETMKLVSISQTWHKTMSSARLEGKRNYPADDTLAEKTLFEPTVR